LSSFSSTQIGVTVPFRVVAGHLAFLPEGRAPIIVDGVPIGLITLEVSVAICGEWMLSAMPGLVTVQARGDDVASRVTTAVLAGIQMLCRATQPLCLLECQLIAGAVALSVTHAHGKVAVVTAT